MSNLETIKNQLKKIELGLEQLDKQEQYVEFRKKNTPGHPFVSKLLVVSEKVNQLREVLNFLIEEEERLSSELLEDAFENADDEFIGELRKLASENESSDEE